MTVNGVKAFLSGVKAAGITKYQYDTDLGTHYYNDPEAHTIAVFDEKTQTIVNFRPKVGVVSVYAAPINIFASDIGDIHEASLGCTPEQAKKLLTATGLKLDPDPLNVVLNIDSNNYNIKPETGDYSFAYKSASEIAAMTPAEKTDYEERKKEYEDPSLRKGTAARITI